MKINENGPAVVVIDLGIMSDDEAVEALDGIPAEMMVTIRGPAARMLSFVKNLPPDVQWQITIGT